MKEDTPNKAKESLQESLQRSLDHVNRLILTLENRISGLVGMSDPITMSSAEREEAANRHFKVMQRMLKLLKKYNQAMAEEELEMPDEWELVRLIHGDEYVESLERKRLDYLERKRRGQEMS